MKFLKDIFLKDRAFDSADNVFNTVSSGVDKAFYTKEEQADHRMRAAELKIKLLQAYEPFKLAQRLIAALLVSTLCINVLVGTVFVVLTFWFGDRAWKVVELVISLCSATIVTPVSVVVGFYFFGGLKGMVTKKKEEEKK